MKNFTKIAILATILLSFSINSSLKAQFQMPNSGFETFQTGFNGQGQQPTGWRGSNVVQSAAGTTVRATLVNSASPGRDGTGNCVYLHNEWVGALGIGAPAPAFIALGTPWNEVDGASTTKAIGGCTDGLAFTYRPDTLEIWIRRTYTSQENARVLVYLWKGTSLGTSYRNKGGSCQSSSRTNEEADIRGKNSCTTTQRATLVGEGVWASNQQFSNWTLIKVPVTYYNSDVPEKINIIISAGNTTSDGDPNSIRDGSKLWADDLRLIYSSKADRLLVGGRSVSANFHPDTLSYTYSLGPTVTTIPSITAFRAGRQLSSSEITITNGVIDGDPSTVTVRAEDGSSTTTYSIYFVSQLSNNPRPINILIDGSPLRTSNGNPFNGHITNYNITLPYGTTDCPEISVETADGGQTFNIINCTSLPGSATVAVTAADGTGPVVYTINFTVAPFSDNTLQNILIDGEPLLGFRPTFNNYTLELPSGTTQAPTITPVSAYAAGMQTIITDNSLFPSPSTIRVFPTNAPNLVRTYTIRYEIVSSSYAYLNDIKVGNVSLENFAPDRLSYNYVLPRSTTDLPSITYDKGEQNQSVTVVSNGVNGTTLITVRAEDGSTVVYRINFSVFRSENSLLNDILIDGQSLPNFDPETLIYDIELPSGTTVMPAISYIAGDAAQNIRVTNGGLNGITTIRVIAENPQFFTTYSLRFSVALSANSQLNAILVDGDTIDGFSPEILNYNYILPATATECPDIDVIKASLGQQVFIVKPALTGIATIRVASETADGENIYTINFQFELSDNNFLDSIKIDGELLAEFNSATTSYTIDLPQYAIAPAVEYFASDSTSRIFVIDNGLGGMQIAVTAQNGATRTYSINYNVAPTNNVDLADIEIWDNAVQDFVSLADFDPQTTEYDYSLVWRTNTVPAINPVAAENGQVITVFYNPVNDTTEIQVVAPNGIDQKSYKIYFPVEKSNYSLLSSITIDGAEISSFPPHPNYFHPQIFNYNIALPYGTTQTPQVAFEKGRVGNQIIFEQNIEITAGSITDPYRLKVIAEDGTTQTYTLNFSIDMSDRIGENYLNNILANGIPVTGFNNQTLEYNVVLPYGTTELPDLSFEKMYSEQTIATDISGIWGTTRVRVFSNIAGIATTEYRINFSVSDIPTTTLNSISFNGVMFNNFSPKVYSYIIPVTAQPTYTYTHNQNEVFVDEIFSNHKKLVLEVTSQSDEFDKNTYTFWYYYTNDIIPNPSFENWSNMAQASGIKPTSWTCQGDVRSSVGLFSLANQVQRSTDRKTGSFSVFMQGQYNGSTTGDENGLITLGGVTSTGSTLGNHSTTVTGGIDFRNTPDLVTMDYKYTRSGTQNPSMYFVFRMWNSGANYSAGERVAEIIDADGTTRSNWFTKEYGVSYAGENRYPTRMNIILSSNNSENSYSYPTGRRGQLWVDNLMLVYDSKLSGISINSTNISGFSPDTYVYYVNAAPEDMGRPVVLTTGRVPDQEHRITISNENSSRQRTVTIISKAEDNVSTSTYTVIITRPVATISTLAGISIDGTPIADFEPNTFEYNVTVNSGTIFSPDVFVTKGEGHQNISYSFGNKKVTITVTAENGTQQIYTVNFVEETSDDATLLNIEVAGYDIEFSSETTEYQVILPASAQNIPQIFFTKQNEGQKVILTTSSTNGTSVVRVEAQDGVNFTDYQIHFSTLPIVTSHLLSGISLGNIPINNFEPTTFDYTVRIDNYKKFVFEKEFVADTITVVYFDDSIKCYIGENIYKIVFETSALNNAYLADIAIDGTSVSGFQPNQFTYSVNWDGDNLPYISVKSGAAGQTITYIWTENSINITVTAQDGITQNDYTVIFVPAILSSNSLLANILIDGVSLEDFVSNEFNYAVELPDGTIYIPVIQAVKGEPHQTITMTTNGINDVTTILVTAQDGSQSTYTINFTVRLSDNAYLSEILINGVLINGFRPDSLIYDYIFPYGTTSFVVEYTKGHPRQTVTVQDNGVHGQYIITVTSESGDSTNIYIINFDVEPSSYAYLDSILSNGTLISGFYPEGLEYTLILPYGTENVPNITYVAGDSGQEIDFTNAATLSDTIFISVTAENGINHNLYKVSFEVALSSNALLDDIIINGEPLRENATGFRASEDFNSEIFEYEVTMPYGTTEFPVVTWLGQVNDYHSITFTNNGFDNISVIEVISQDERFINEYFITFVVGLSSNSSLDNIYINGVPLENFHSDTIEYTIYYPVGTQESELITNIDDITFVKGDEHQSVVVSFDEFEPTTIKLEVTAQDGSLTVYIINQIILKSDNALLADIIIDGKSIEGFESTKFYYEYKVPFNAVSIPEFVGVKQEETQELEYSPNPIDSISTILVIAEDNFTVNEYRIKFIRDTNNPGNIPTKENTCVVSYPDGTWKFSTNRNNVSIHIFDPAGRLVQKSDIPLADPNDDLCGSEIGVIFQNGKKGQVYVYMFVYNNKQKIQNASGKFFY